MRRVKRYPGQQIKIGKNITIDIVRIDGAMVELDVEVQGGERVSATQATKSSHLKNAQAAQLTGIDVTA